MKRIACCAPGRVGTAALHLYLIGEEVDEILPSHALADSADIIVFTEPDLAIDLEPLFRYGSEIHLNPWSAADKIAHYQVFDQNRIMSDYLLSTCLAPARLSSILAGV
ncbi:MAG TPA: hypothetical protein VFQ44_01880 [Streptosporangiaceae bacterium]|nr:hypothetical protein [Streptosporangiaceae bacterium]